jgi:hypothetical protein
MKKTALAVAAVAAFVLVDFAGSAVAAPFRIAPSISASHDAVTTVAAKKKKTAAKKTASKKTSKKSKKA